MKSDQYEEELKLKDKIIKDLKAEKEALLKTSIKLSEELETVKSQLRQFKEIKTVKNGNK